MYLRLLSVLLLSGAVLSNEIPDDEGVLVLTTDNFDGAVSSNDFVLVEFYAPWCGHCKALAPAYVTAAAKLKELGSNVKLAKVDATVETELAEKHNVRGYPTLKFFRNGQPVEYTGGRQPEDIVSWVTKKSGPPAKTLASAAEIKEFVDTNGNAVIVGFFDSETSEAAKTYVQVANAIDESAFGIVTSPEVLKEYNVDKTKVIVFKKFDEPNAELAEIEDFNQLKNYVLVESMPLVIEFNHESAPKIFGGGIKSHLLLFLSKKEGQIEELIPKILDIAKKFRQHLLFVSIDVDEPDHNRILDFFGIKPTDIPNMRILHLDEEMTKYKPETASVTPQDIEKFAQAYVDGTLKEHLLAEDLPEDWDKHPVKVLVSSNFDEVVFNKEKEVLVEFFAPWCTHCKRLAPIYDKLGESFENRNDIVIAKLDASANELPHTKITNFPTIKLYKKGDNEIIEYQGERTLEDLIKFVESGGEIGGGTDGGPLMEEEEEHDEGHAKDEL